MLSRLWKIRKGLSEVPACFDGFFLVRGFVHLHGQLVPSNIETLLLWHLPDRWIILDLAEIEGFA